jgi:FkbM family methyltransferase
MNNPIQLILNNYIPIEKADFLDSLFGKSKKTILEGKEKVVVYGAGSAAKELFECLQLHHIEVECFCDKNIAMIGSLFQDKKVISIEILCEEYKDKYIVIGVLNQKDEVYNFLRNEGFQKVCLIKDEEKFYYYLQFPRWKNSLEKLIKDEPLILAAYQLLADQQSKDIFIKRLSALASFADFNSYKRFCELSDFPHDLPPEKRVFRSNFENQKYFDNDLIKLDPGTNLIDCGAFDGDSFIEFKGEIEKKGFDYSMSYCIEPDKTNFNKLQKNIGAFKNIQLFNLGAWNKKAILDFANSDIMYVTESCVVEKSNDKVIKSKGKSNELIKADSIDSLIYPNKVGIIKMDIEGSESKALVGAKKTIRKFHPQLIISAYHKSSDLYNLAILINKIHPGYKLYLRHFSFSWSETVLIAVD